MEDDQIAIRGIRNGYIVLYGGQEYYLKTSDDVVFYVTAILRQKEFLAKMEKEPTPEYQLYLEEKKKREKFDAEKLKG